MNLGIIVSVGDVVDLRGSEIRESRDGRKGLLCILRDEKKNASISLLASAEDKDLLVGRITKINKVSNLVRAYGHGWKIFTNVYCEFENAWGETPKYICENSPVSWISKKGNGKDWKRPEFSTGGLDATEKEK